MTAQIGERRKDHNTIIEYLYRDASNYKKRNVCVIQGEITMKQIDEIRSCLQDGIYFIPKQVGLPEERFDEITEDDHCWFELVQGAFSSTRYSPTVDLTVDQLVENFKAAKDDWRDDLELE